MEAKGKMHLFEGMYILSATLSEDARNKALERITEGITSRGGVVHKIHEQGRRKLAYQIRGKKEGFYYVLYFEAPPEEMKKMWREYHLNEDLLRFITLRAEEVVEEIKFKSLAEV
ncbi:MAG: 30S ribosomal protein S6 [Simkaniaceae bacterium]|nr:30S ribosomal protein S6 [Simkaniaceae bacterium]